MSASADAIAGKYCLITGGTAGIGFVTARELARRGAHVIIAGRNAEKCARAAAAIQQETASEPVQYLVGDLSSQRDVRRVASEYREQHRRLDVLINNAGALNLDRRVSADGIELTFALNHLAYFLLTDRLLDLLQASAPARIINVSSEAHRRGHIDFDDLQNAGHYRGWQVYCQTKLANIYFTYELARRLGPPSKSGLTVNVLHPGLVNSNFGRNNGIRAALMWAFIRWFAISPERGAQTSVFLAASEEVATKTGKYFVNEREERSSAVSYDTRVAERLWDVSARMIEATGAARGDSVAAGINEG